MAFDAHANLALSTVLFAPTPQTSGTSLTIQAADAPRFPATPFNCTLWAAGATPVFNNAEIVRVTNISGNVFTIIRAQENTAARFVQVGDQIALTVTAKTLTDIEAATGQGGGNVSNTGTPTANQLAGWTNATTVQGITLGTNLNLVGTTLNATGGGGSVTVSGTPSLGQLTGWVNATTIEGIVLGTNLNLVGTTLNATGSGSVGIIGSPSAGQLTGWAGATSIEGIVLGTNLNLSGTTINVTSPSITGTPANGQLTGWANATTVEGITLGTNLSLVGTTLNATGGGGGGGSPGGANTQVQYNAAGSFAGNSGFTTDGAGNVTVHSVVSVGTVADQSGIIGNRIADKITVTNSFAAGSVVWNNNGTWTLANANAAITSSAVGVVESASSGTFVVVYDGPIVLAGLSPSTTYYLSDSTAGSLTTTAPVSITSYVVPVLRSATTLLGYVEVGTPASLSTVGIASGGTGLTTLPSHAVLLGRGVSPMGAVTLTGSVNSILMSNGSNADAAWSASSYPNTGTPGQMIYATGTNVFGVLPTLNNGVLTSGGTGLPTWLAPGPNNYVLQTLSGTIGWGSVSGTGGGTGNLNGSGVAPQVTQWVTGSTVGGIPTSSNSVLISNGAGAPTWLPPGTNSYVLQTLSGTIGWGSVSGASGGGVNGTGVATQITQWLTGSTLGGVTSVGVPNGGTGLATATSHGVMVGQGAAPFNAVASGTVSQVMISNGSIGDPAWQGGINPQSNNYTFGLTDSNATVYHPFTDTTTRTWTLPPNSSVSYPVNTLISMVNDFGAGSITVNTGGDQMVQMGGTGTVSYFSLPQSHAASTLKVAPTRWVINVN